MPFGNGAISAILMANSLSDFNSLVLNLHPLVSRLRLRLVPCPLLRWLIFVGLIIVERARLSGRGDRDRLQRANTRCARVFKVL